MSWLDYFQVKKDDASTNNYKLDLFNRMSNNVDVASMSSIKKYFNSLYDFNGGGGFSAFTINQSLPDLYVSENNNKGERLADYRAISYFHEVISALDMMCYSANVPDENNEIVKIVVKDDYLEGKDVDRIKRTINEYLNLFDFENNFEEYFRTLMVEGQVCWENIVAKDQLEAGIIGINLIPNEAYDFCYDMKTRQKIGIMITNTSADDFALASSMGVHALTSKSLLPGSTYNSLNCYEDLLEDKCFVMPWNQLTYIDSGMYSKDGRYVFPIIERCRRPLNQLKLIEDAILIYRVSRSPEKYVFNVDIGKMSAKAGEQKVAQLKKQFGTKKAYDPATGSIGKTYDPMQMTENFWFVKGTDSQGISVSPLSNSTNFGNLEDLDYFRKNLLKSLNIPLNRFFGEAGSALINKGDDAGITAEELNFAKFLMSQQRRFSQGLTDGAIVHLKYTGLWDAYKLNRSKIKIILNPPIEYDIYRRQKLLDNKVTMLKNTLGEEVVTKLFSSEMALELFMGWDKDTIKKNKEQKFNEEIEAARKEFLINKMKENGAIDLKPEDADESFKTFRDVLQQGLNDSLVYPEDEVQKGTSAPSESSDEEFSDESTGTEMGLGDLNFGTEEEGNAEIGNVGEGLSETEFNAMTAPEEEKS